MKIHEFRLLFPLRFVSSDTDGARGLSGRSITGSCAPVGWQVACRSPSDSDHTPAERGNEVTGLKTARGAWQTTKTLASSSQSEVAR